MNGWLVLSYTVTSDKTKSSVIIVISRGTLYLFRLYKFGNVEQALQ